MLTLTPPLDQHANHSDELLIAQYETNKPRCLLVTMWCTASNSWYIFLTWIYLRAGCSRPTQLAQDLLGRQAQIRHAPQAPMLKSSMPPFKLQLAHPFFNMHNLIYLDRKTEFVLPFYSKNHNLTKASILTFHALPPHL